MECSGDGGWRIEGRDNGVNLWISSEIKKVLGSILYKMVFDQDTLLLQVILIRIKNQK